MSLPPAAEITTDITLTMTLPILAHGVTFTNKSNACLLQMHSSGLSPWFHLYTSISPPMLHCFTQYSFISNLGVYEGAPQDLYHFPLKKALLPAKSLEETL